MFLSHFPVFKIGNSEIQCFCCKKILDLLGVEPNFFCASCVRLKEIHNSSPNDVSPIKWYSKISNEIKSIELKITKKIYKINNLTIKELRLKKIQMKNFRLESIRALITKLKIENELKISRKQKVQADLTKVDCELKSVISKSSLTNKHIDDLYSNQKELVSKIMQIQEYLNKLQHIFIVEIFRLFPITLCKYEKDTICNLPFHIELSDSSVLESNDSTASAILLLTIVATSVSYILDICYSSMDIKQFALSTLCRHSEPLKRDEIMCVYRFLVRTVHHITQSTLFRSDITDDDIAKLISVDSLSLTSIDELNANNYPLKKLVVLRDNLNAALLMRGISNPYQLRLSHMFQNEFINDYSICYKIHRPSYSEDVMDFVEISSIISNNELPSIYQSDTNMSNQSISEWFLWVKNGFT